MVRAKTIATCHILDPHAIFQSLRNNAGLHLIGPTPVTLRAKDQIRTLMCPR
ncbi:hypothetical protein IWQ49_001032 [Labrenzia sp. EL_126]|nr:hypothetical protein [Labrenzia sp. EL_126]